MTNFRQVQSFQLNYSPCKLTQYVSERSGMHVVVVDREGPKVEGYFGLATETLNDSGAPHTLEHLVFQASEKYPYRGLLDKLASRLFSSTNAWTATDHTAYTLETAGWKAFKEVLPVYLAHVLAPRITDATVTTEVWHIDGEGNDSGVVYSEMQAVEYAASWRTMTKLQQIMYPEGSGFRYETGGLPTPLRDLTIDQIVAFHKTMYQPRNLGVIVLGQVDHAELLDVLDKLEDLIKDSIPPLDSAFTRPWIESEQPPPLKETIAAETTFPEEDESHGDVTISWFGPHCVDFLQITALEVVSSYLTGSSASVLEKALVETEQLASETSSDNEPRPNSLFSIYFSGVETDKLELVRDRAYAILAELATKPLDMKYLADCLNRSYRRARFDADGFDNRLPTQIIMDFIYGSRDGSTLSQLETLGHYKTLEGWSEDEWRAFIKKWLLDAHSVSVLTRPSMALAVEIKEKEEKRLADRKEALGEEGLRKVAERLEKAKKENKVDIPDEMLTAWSIPPAETIPLFKVDMARVGPARQLGNGAGPVQQLIDAADVTNSPLFIQFDQVPWKFVEVSVHVTVSSVPEDLLPLVPVFVENFFKSPIRRRGADGSDELIDHEQVVKEIEADTIDYQIDSAEWLGDKNSLMVTFSIEPSKYARAIEWLRTVALDSVFDPERLLVAVGKLYADVPYAKRNGKEMANQVSDAINMGHRFLPNAGSEIVASHYLPRLKKALKERPDEVVGWFEQIRTALFRRENMRALVVGDIAALQNPVAAWEPLASALAPSDAPPIPITKALEFRTPEGLAPGAAGAVVVPITALDSSFLVSTGRGINGYTDPRLPAAMVAVAYLQMPEGPLWTTIRGQGLAYGAYIGRNINSGLTRFIVYRSPDAAKAMAAAHALVARIASGDEPISQVAVDGAISQVVSLYMDQASTPSSAGSMDFVWTAIRGMPQDIVSQHLAAVGKVTVEEIREIVREFIQPLLEPGRCNVVVACGKKMSEGMEKSFNDMGFATKVKGLSEFTHDYGLDGPASDDSDESEEESGSEDDEGSDDEEESEKE